MNRVLSLDISTKTGFAELVREGSAIKQYSYGLLRLEGAVANRPEPYPWNFTGAADDMALLIHNEVVKHPKIDSIVIEETNLGKQRFSQKILEFIHLRVLQTLGCSTPIYYVSSSAWRKHLGIHVSKEDRKQNAKLSRAKSVAKKTDTKLDKKTLGIRGRVTRKHAAVWWANETYGLDLKIKDNDIADALAVGTAALMGVTFSIGDER